MLHNSRLSKIETRGFRKVAGMVRSGKRSAEVKRWLRNSHSNSACAQEPVTIWW